jgi:hypothetical protein
MGPSALAPLEPEQPSKPRRHQPAPARVSTEGFDLSVARIFTFLSVIRFHGWSARVPNIVAPRETLSARSGCRASASSAPPQAVPPTMQLVLS